jgi:hypothetical protein
MKLRSFPKVTCLFMALAMFGGSLFAAPPIVSPCASIVQWDDWSFPLEASQLLKEIQSTSAQLTSNTDRLESFIGKGLQWESHAIELTFAKEHINAIGERLERLQVIRHVAEPWQRQAIDSIVPVAVHLAARTEAAIRHLKENLNLLWVPEYTDHLKMIADHAGQMKASVDLYLELSSTQEKLEELHNRAAKVGL